MILCYYVGVFFEPHFDAFDGCRAFASLNKKYMMVGAYFE